MTTRLHRSRLTLARRLRDAGRDPDAKAALLDAILVEADIGPPVYALPDGTTEPRLSIALACWLAAVPRRRGGLKAGAEPGVMCPVRLTPRAVAIVQERGGPWASAVIEREGGR